MSFDDRAARGRAAVLAGTHEIEAPPAADGLRWGPSVILRPDLNTVARVGQWTSEVLALTGAGHWATGSTQSAHITVRTLDLRRSDKSLDDLRARYSAAVRAAAHVVESVQFRASHILLSPISVMLALHPLDAAADRLAAELERALEADGWFERGRVRDIWYLNLAHFTSSIADPVGLVQWVDAHQGFDDWCVDAVTLEAVRWEFDGRQMTPERLVDAPVRRTA